MHNAMHAQCSIIAMDRVPRQGTLVLCMNMLIVWKNKDKNDD
jgi:hypothetical protein